MNEKSIKIFVDFDGTITQKDIGEELFLEFGDRSSNQILIDNWNTGELDSWQGWHLLCESVGNADLTKIDEYLEHVQIDPHFKDFVSFCDSNNLPIKIISDGFDFYIKKILNKEDLGHLEFSSNHLEITDDNRFIPHFPNAQEDCRLCGNCKRNFILDNSSDEDYTVYIGDGISDRCPIQYCDFIFAKKSLLKFCEVNRISYFPYSTFADVIKKMNELINKKRLKKRHQADIKRREVYIQG